MRVAAVVGTAPVASDVVSLPVLSEQVTINRTHVPPIVYFDEGGTEFAGGSDAGTATTNRMLDAVAALVRANPNAQVTITASASAAEPPTILKTRMLWATDRIGPVDQSRLTFVRRQAPASRYPAIDAEHRYVRIDVGAVGRTVALDDVTIRTTATPTDVTVVSTTDCPAVTCSTTTIIAVNGAPAASRGALAEAQTVTLTEAVLTAGTMVKVEARASIVDTAGQRDESSLSFAVQPTVQRRDTTVQNASVRDGDATVVGYFDFDETTLSSVNDQARRIAQEAVAARKRLELRVGTDGFGSDAYNAVLAQQRAKAAAEALDVPLTAVDVVPVRNAEGDGTTPQLRAQHRAATLRILP